MYKLAGVPEENKENHMRNTNEMGKIIGQSRKEIEMYMDMPLPCR
jgi:hypothetical protein